MNNPWVIAAVVLVFAIAIGVWLWWHGKKTKAAMEQKPQPKKDQGSQ